MIASKCVVCGGALHFWFSRVGRDVCRCRSCGHIQVPVGVARVASGRSIYEAEESVFEVDGNDEYYLDEGTQTAARDKLRFVMRFCPAAGATLLDVGSSFGHFLEASGGHFRASGIELNARAVAWSIEHFGVRNEVASLYELPATLPESFDVITAWDVIEHLDDPRRALAACRDRLRPGGWLFLSTPDAGAAIARLLGRRWHYQDPVQHVNLFSQTNLQRLLTESGFATRATTHFGRRYRLRYVVNRLRYLAGNGLAGRSLGAITRMMPERIAQGHVSIKLWDVLGVAAQREP